mmetsp:Transcript_21574/g.55513  ORF Transcript_21574/g.55513 Transcript_21574/m.55513 type:complete len:308 (+) Transcript_21574:174-1097(+)
MSTYRILPLTEGERRPTANHGSSAGRSAGRPYGLSEMSNRKTCMHMLGALRAEMESRSTRGGIGYETSTDVILRDSGNGCELRSLRSFVEYYGTFVSQHATNLRQRIEGAMNRVRQIKQARDAETNLLYVEAKIARRQLERIARERTAADIAKDKDFEKMEAEILSARFVGAGAASSQPARMADGSDDAAGSADMGADVPAAPAAAPPFRAQEGGEAGAGLSVRASLPRAAKQRGAIGAGQSAEQMTAPPASDEHAAAPPAEAEPTLTNLREPTMTTHGPSERVLAETRARAPHQGRRLSEHAQPRR